MIPSATQSPELDSGSFVFPVPSCPLHPRPLDLLLLSQTRSFRCSFVFPLYYSALTCIILFSLVSLSPDVSHQSTLHTCASIFVKLNLTMCLPCLKLFSDATGWSTLSNLLCVRPFLLAASDPLGPSCLHPYFPPCLCYCWLFCLKRGLFLLLTPCSYIVNPIHHLRFSSNIASAFLE